MLYVKRMICEIIDFQMKKIIKFALSKLGIITISIRTTHLLI